MSQHENAAPARAAWTAPVLEQLTVDLKAIAAASDPGNDGNKGQTKS